MNPAGRKQLMALFETLHKWDDFLVPGNSRWMMANFADTVFAGSRKTCLNGSPKGSVSTSGWYLQNFKSPQITILLSN